MTGELNEFCVKKGLIIGYAIVLSVILAACQTEGKKQTEPETEIIISQPESTETAAPEQGETNYNRGFEHFALLSGSFFKAGDIRYKIAFELTEEGLKSDQDQIECGFYLQDETHPNSYSSIGHGTIAKEEGKATYEMELDRERTMSDIQETSCRITFDSDSSLGMCIRVEGDDKLKGDYYPFKNSFTFSDVFHRYLCRADLSLYPTEDLMLLRNEIYAAHGRKFNSDVLNQYFSKKEWYRGIIEAGDFSEELLSNVERKNIAFIQEMEKDPNRNRLDGKHQYGLEELPIADYLPLLGKYKETGVEADLTKARDMGAYYQAPGSISVPASITLEQYQAVSEGETVEVVINELTGESKELSLDPEDENGVYGFLLCEKGKEPSEYGFATGIMLDYDTMEYQLWQTSADTVMKTVYEGEIYIMKGAVTGAATSVAEASSGQQEVRIGDSNSYFSGNYPCYNVRGCFTAVYYLGD